MPGPRWGSSGVPLAARGAWGTRGARHDARRGALLPPHRGTVRARCHAGGAGGVPTPDDGAGAGGLADTDVGRVRGSRTTWRRGIGQRVSADLRRRLSFPRAASLSRGRGPGLHRDDVSDNGSRRPNEYLGRPLHVAPADAPRLEHGRAVAGPWLPVRL